MGRLLRWGGGGLLVCIVVAVLIATSGFVGLPGLVMEDPGDWQDVSEDSVTVRSQLAVDNPNPFPLAEGANVSYTLALNGVHVGDGTATARSLAPGTSPVTVDSVIHLDTFPEWWRSHLRNDERSTLTMRGTVEVPLWITTRRVSVTERARFQTRIAERMERSLSRQEGVYSPGRLPGELEVTDVRVELEPVSDRRTELRLSYEIHNGYRVPLVVPGAEGELEMNGIRVATWRANDIDLTEDELTIAPGGTRTIDVVAPMDTEAVADWFASHVRRGEYTEFEVTGRLSVELNGRELAPGLFSVRCTPTMQTAWLVDGQEPDTSSPNCDVGTAGDDSGQQTDGGGESTDRDATDTSTSGSEQPPTADIEVITVDPEAGADVEFSAAGSSDPDGDIVEYRWQFGDTSRTGSGVTVTHRYRRAGEFTVRLVVIDEDGNRDIETMTVEVDRRLG